MSSTSQKILIADKLADHVLPGLAALGLDVESQPDLSADDLSHAISDFDVLVVRSTKVTAATIQAASQLGLVVRAGAGVNTIDLAAASERGIQVANCPGTNAAAVAELAIGLLVAADRRIAFASEDLRNGRWRKKEYGKSHGLKGRTLGLVGFGSIAKAVAKAAQGLEMNVVAWSRSLTQETAESFGVEFARSPLDLAAISDAVSVHMAFTKETKHFVNAEFLDAMRDGSILINTSRGDLVDTNALQNAIANKSLRVGVDVFENEPTSGDSEFEQVELAKVLTATPHIGASTTQTSNAVGDAVVDLVKDYIANGRVQTAVNLLEKGSATQKIIVRHLNKVGVLAEILDGLRSEKINVEETENRIFQGGIAAVCSMRVDRKPSSELIEQFSSNDAIMNVSVTETLES